MEVRSGVLRFGEQPKGNGPILREGEAKVMPSTLGGERARDRGDAAVAERGGERDGGDHRAVAGIAPYLEFARRSGRGFVRDVLHKIGRASCRERVCQYV